MSENDAISRIRDIKMPDYYFNYYSNLSNNTTTIFESAASAKATLFDSTYEIYTHNATRNCKLDLFKFIKEAEDAGAGEILINSIDCDGLMNGYNLSLASKIRRELSIPMTFLGGAGCLDDLQDLVKECGIIGVAAGSIFVFKGKYKAVLINYPNKQQKVKIFESINA